MAYLGARGFTPATVTAALQGLHDLRYIDDAALARRRAEELLLRRGCGRVRVVHELTRRGVAGSVVEAAIAGVLGGRSDAELAREALQRRFADWPPATAAARARVFRFLTGRGHPAEVVSEILEIEEDA
jgi:SOS response regulatory protein OraA/RecX